MTRNYDIGQQNIHFGNTDTVSNVDKTYPESNVINLFNIGASKVGGRENKTKPFIHRVKLLGLQGEVIRVWANIDDGAMKEVMSLEMFKKVKHRLG